MQVSEIQVPTRSESGIRLVGERVLRGLPPGSLRRTPRPATSEPLHGDRRFRLRRHTSWAQYVGEGERAPRATIYALRPRKGKVRRCCAFEACTEPFCVTTRARRAKAAEKGQAVAERLNDRERAALEAHTRIAEGGLEGEDPFALSIANRREALGEEPSSAWSFGFLPKLPPPWNPILVLALSAASEALSAVLGAPDAGWLRGFELAGKAFAQRARRTDGAPADIAMGERHRSLALRELTKDRRTLVDFVEGRDFYGASLLDLIDMLREAALGSAGEPCNVTCSADAGHGIRCGKSVPDLVLEIVWTAGQLVDVVGRADQAGWVRRKPTHACPPSVPSPTAERAVTAGQMEEIRKVVASDWALRKAYRHKFHARKGRDADALHDVTVDVLERRAAGDRRAISDVARASAQALRRYAYRGDALNFAEARYTEYYAGDIDDRQRRAEASAEGDVSIAIGANLD